MSEILPFSVALLDPLTAYRAVGARDRAMDDAARREADEQEIVAALRRRDEDGLRRLLSCHGGRVRGWLRTRFGGRLSEQDLLEILHESAWNVWRRIDRFEPDKGSLGAWFLRIASNVAVDVIRRESRQRHELLGAAIDSTAEPAAAAAVGPQARRLREIVHRIVESLPRLQREILRADLQAGGLAESDRLAAELGTSLNSVYVSRSKARRRLARELQSLGLMTDEEQER